MNNGKNIEQKLVIKTAFIKHYEFVPIVVYLIFLVGFIWEGIDKKQIVIMTILALIMIFIGVKRLIDNKPKIIIDSNGLKLVDENLKLEWHEIVDIEIGEKTVRYWNSFKTGYDSTINVKCLIVRTKNEKKIEKIIEKYKYSKKHLKSVLQFYLGKDNIQ